MWRRHKLFLQTKDFIEEIITITIITIATIVIPHTIATNKNYITSCVIKKDTTYRNILRRSKKSLKLNLKINSRTASRSK